MNLRNLDIDFAHPYEDYVILHENNGGALIRHIYKIEKDKIKYLGRKNSGFARGFPSLEEIQSNEANWCLS